MSTRCAVYLRISLDATGEGLAVDRQREDARKLAAERSWVIVEEYVDNSISAFNRSKVRPAYERMLADYRDGRFDALIVWDLDRLTRQPRQLEDWIEYAEDRGLKLVTANGEADLTTDAGRLFARIKAAVARGESERKGARQVRAIRQRVESGKVLSGVRLTGYARDGTVIPDEATVVRDVFSQFAAGESLKGLARLLDERGAPTRHGGKWSPSSVGTILRNGRYAGRVMFKGEQTGAQGDWEPIVSGELFELVQARLDDPRRVLNREGTARKWLGSSLYLCGICEGTVRTNGMRYWCPQGGHVIRSMPRVDALVCAVVEARLSRPDIADAFRSRDEGAVAALRADAENLRARLQTIESDYDNGVIDGIRFRAASDKVKTQLRHVERERAKLIGDPALGALVSTADPAVAFRSASLDIRRAVVRALMTVRLHPAPRGSKTFDPRSVQIDWKAS